MNAKSVKFSIIVESDDLLPDSPCLNHEIAVVLTFQITLNDDSNHFFDLSKQMEMVLTGGTVALVIISLLNPAVELLTILLRTGILVIL